MECRETFFGCEVKLLPFFPRWCDRAIFVIIFLIIRLIIHHVLIGAVRVFFNLLYFCSQLVLYGSVATIAQEDHDIFGNIPGFFTHSYNDKFIKPIFVFSKDDISQTDNDNLQVFLRYCMEKIQLGQNLIMEYFQGKTIEEISAKISEILLSFN